MQTEINKRGIVKRRRKRFMLFVLCVILVVVAYRKINGKRESPTDSLSKTVANFVGGEEGEVITISESSVKKVFEISELSTADYTYNAIVRAYAEDETTIRYYVAYEGKVKAGIDFNNIIIDINNEKKEISITLPDVEFQEKTVNPGTMEYIFKEKNSETETVHQEAYELCKKDLEERVEKEEELLEIAKENTMAVVEALVKPWVEQINNEYRVEIQYISDKEDK